MGDDKPFVVTDGGVATLAISAHISGNRAIHGRSNPRSVGSKSDQANQGQRGQPGPALGASETAAVAQMMVPGRTLEGRLGAGCRR